MKIDKRPDPLLSWQAEPFEAGKVISSSTATMQKATTSGAASRAADLMLEKAEKSADQGHLLKARGQLVTVLPLVIAAMVDEAVRGDKATSKVSKEELAPMVEQFAQAHPYARAHLAELANRWLNDEGTAAKLLPEAKAALEKMVRASFDPTGGISHEDRLEANTAINLHQWVATNFSKAPSASETEPLGERALAMFKREVGRFESFAGRNIEATVLASLADDQGKARIKVDPANVKAFDSVLDSLRRDLATG